MRVVVTVPHFSLQIGRNESGLATALQRLGHDACVITTNLSGQYRYRTPPADVVGDLPYSLVVVPQVPLTHRNPIPVGLRCAIEGFRPDLVHSSEDTDMLTVCAFRGAREAGLPFVLSTERYYVPEFPKNLPYLLIERAWTQHIRAGADVVTTHSTIQKSYWKERGMGREDVQMIPVGVWTDEFTPGKSDMLRSRFGIPKDWLALLTVGRMTHYKDYPTMIRGLRAAVDEDPAIAIVAVGSGPQRERLERLVKQLGLVEHIRFAKERVPHEEMPELLRSADAYIQTSSVEPFGISVVEAMSAGVPPLVTNVGGMRDTVVDGVTGLQVEARNPGAVAEGILRLRDQALRTRLGAAARTRAVSEFDWMVVARAYSSAYQRAIEINRGGHRGEFTAEEPTVRRET